MFREEGLEFQTELNLSAALWNANRKSLPVAAKKKKLRGKNGQRRSVRKLRRNELISSVETDGYGVSIVVKTPHLVRAADPKSAKQAAEDHMAALSALYASEECAVMGIDPGRVNLVVSATIGGKRVTPETLGEARSAEFGMFSRSRWNGMMRNSEKAAWERVRRERPAVRAALEALSESGGKRNVDAARWTAYLDASVAHWGALVGEFMEDDERAARKMVHFRRRQRTMAKIASHVVRPEDKRPLLIVYGNAKLCCHGHGSTDTPVPVKGIYRAILLAFKQHRKRGGVFKGWEFLTTQKCHRCSGQLEVMVGENGEEIRDFRRCATCTHEERPKSRNRDFNAAKNILTVGLCSLLGQPRPVHLCPAPKPHAPRAPRVARVLQEPQAPRAPRAPRPQVDVVREAREEPIA
jgi:transposase